MWFATEPQKGSAASMSDHSGCRPPPLRLPRARDPIAAARDRAAVDDGGGLPTRRCEYHLKRKGEDFDQTAAHPKRPTMSN